MGLFVEKWDKRFGDETLDVIDREGSGIADPVGEVKLQRGVGCHINLFGRYKKTMQTYEECMAFIKGVEVVLEHMIG